MRLRPILWLLLVSALSPPPASAQAPPASADKPVSFGVIADVQYADADASGTRHYRASLTKLAECVDDLNSRELLFTIQLGDLIDHDPASYDRILPVFSRLKMPTHHVLGNHDFALPREEVLTKLGLTEPYHTFSHGKWCFIVLDTLDISTSGGWPKDDDHYTQAEGWREELRNEPEPASCNKCGGLGEQQRRWLQKTLEDAREDGQRVIVFGHIPVAASPGNEWALLHGHDQVQAMLESSGCVVAYINGHAHEGGYAYAKGIHYLNIEGMIETADETAYAVIELHPDRIEVHGRGRTPSRTLPLAQCAGPDLQKAACSTADSR